MADLERRTKRYPSDVTDEEWALIAPLLPGEARTGRRREIDLREVINALRYLVRAGVGWRMLPKDFPPWQTVYWWFRRLLRRFLFQTIHDLALMFERELAGREASPSAAVVDSQSVKAPSAAGGGGYDAAKKVKGRKRHVAVDTDGRLLMVNLTSADVQDAAGAEPILAAIRKRWPWVKHLFADGAYDRGQLMSKAAFLDFVVEVVRRLAQPGFHVLPRRWVVERTLGWMTRWRRLVRDYERRLDVSEAMIHIAMGSLLIRRIAHPT
jgi:putative transposase